MSQIPCKQSTRIEMTGWFKQSFPGNLRNFLFTVCNYTSYQSLQKSTNFLKVLFQMFYLEQNESRLRFGVCNSLEG